MNRWRTAGTCPANFVLERITQLTSFTFMKTPALLFRFLFAMLAVAVRAEDAPATQPAPAAPASLTLSDMQKLLSAARPKFATPEEVKPAPEPNPDVVELPKMTVKQRPRPRLGQIEVMGPKAFNEDLAKKNLTKFDTAFLNRFTLPLFGTSAAERAREDYNIAQKQQFLSDVLTIAKAAEIADPANAKALREAATKP